MTALACAGEMSVAHHDIAEESPGLPSPEEAASEALASIGISRPAIEETPAIEEYPGASSRTYVVKESGAVVARAVVVPALRGQGWHPALAEACS